MTRPSPAQSTATDAVERIREFITRWRTTTHAFDTDEVAEFVGLVDYLDEYMTTAKRKPMQWIPHSCVDCQLEFESAPDVTRHLLAVHVRDRRVRS